MRNALLFLIAIAFPLHAQARSSYPIPIHKETVVSIDVPPLPSVYAMPDAPPDFFIAPPNALTPPTTTIDSTHSHRNLWLAAIGGGLFGGYEMGRGKHSTDTLTTFDTITIIRPDTILIAPPVTSTPEPSTIVLAISGFLLVAGLARKANQPPRSGD